MVALLTSRSYRIMISSRAIRAARRSAIPVVASILLLAVPGVAHAAPPTNDDFADAIAVTEPLPYIATQDTSEATSEPGEPSLADFGCGFIAATVWYSFAPSADTIVAADTVGSDFDTILAVWEGSDLGSLTLVGCADDTRGGVQSSVPFLAEAGVEYRIQVGGFVGQGGSLSFRARQTTAGFIEGTVTSEDTAAPLAGICVVVIDAVFANNANLGITAVDGTYRVAARPGEYVVAFFDCKRDAYISEFYDGAATDADATELVVVADAAVSGIDAALAPACPGFGSSGMHQIIGTSGADTLLGTTAPDVICGFAGNDVLRGRVASDVLFGGAGADVLTGNDGSDSLIGGSGRDSLFGGDGRDDLDGGRDRDECDGGRGVDLGFRCEVERRIES
jgi:Ca2+-binding RTX toxin-like protein